MRKSGARGMGKIRSLAAHRFSDVAIAAAIAGGDGIACEYELRFSEDGPCHR